MYTDHPALAILEDFDFVGNDLHAALIRQSASPEFRTNIRTAVIATTLTISLDYARRRYVEDDDSPTKLPAKAAYVHAYRAAKDYLARLRARMKPGRSDPGAGVFTASVVLERLPASFFCAHLLYGLGHRYEGHAVSRLILEQIAWAYAAHLRVEVDSIEKIETTRSISTLKLLCPEVGKLYGFLSAKTHIDFGSHLEFLQIHGDSVVIQYAQREYGEYADVLLQLADLFGIVWEVSQNQYLTLLETVDCSEGIVKIRPDRPFAHTMRECLASIEQASVTRDADGNDP